MKKFLTKITGLVVLFILFIAFTAPVKANEGITFSFANAQITGSSPSYLEFDIMVHATANTQFKVAQVYINYNTDAFNPSIYGNSKVTVTPGALLAQVNNGGTGLYGLSINDNTTSILSIANTWFGTGTGYDLTNTLGTTDQVYVHVKIEIQDPSKPNGISFNESISQWNKQDLYFTSGDNESKYVVTEIGTIAIALPVELNSFNAKPQGSKVELNWNTATEINNYGFEIQRELDKQNVENNNWVKVGFVKGNGNSNSPNQYSFIDKESSRRN